MVMSEYMLYSKSSEYAIQAMVYLAEVKSKEPVLTKNIAKEYNIPYQFLAKIVQTLVKHRLVKATRGRTGGINLYQDASKIYLSQIVDAIDGPPPIKEAKNINSALNTAIESVDIMLNQGVAKAMDFLNQSNS